MTLEERYKAQLTDMGIYRPAFDPEIKLLCQMERELRRVDNAWRPKDENGNRRSPDYTHKLYDRIVQLRKDILAHRESLGLTPKGYKRLRPEQTGAPSDIDPHSAALEALEARCAAYD